MAFTGNASFPYYGTAAAELTIRPAVLRKGLQDVFAISEGLKGTTYVSFLERIGLITIKDPGCGLGAKTFGTRKTGKVFAPVDLKAWHQECALNLRGTAEEVFLKPGNDKGDLTDTEYGATMLSLLESAIGEDLLRMAHFADKSITSAAFTDSITLASGQTFTAAQLVPFFKTFNGLFANTAIGIANGLTKYVNIPQNVTTGNQVFAAADAFPLFQKIFAAQDPRMVGVPSNQKLFMVTYSIFNAYVEWRESQNLDLSYVNQADGNAAPTFRGIPIVAMPEWDEMIGMYFKPSTLNGKTDRPHRAILSTKGNFQLRFDGTPVDSNGGADLKVWFSDDTELWNARQTYSADEQTADDALVVAAY